MTAEDYLKLRGVSVDWLDIVCSDLVNGECNADEARDILLMLEGMLLAGVPLPPKARALVGSALRLLARGDDARELVGTKPGRGAPKIGAVSDKHQQLAACMELLRLAEIPVTEAVDLVAGAAPIEPREIWDLPKVEAEGEWNHVPFLAEIGLGDSGCGVLRRLIERRPSDPDLHASWSKFRKFCTVNSIE